VKVLKNRTETRAALIVLAAGCCSRRFWGFGGT
jgi:hypothetical protein